MALKNQARLEEVKKSHAKKFDITDLGKLHHFLGMKVTVATPTGTSTRLVKVTDGDECADQQQYQSAVGSLLTANMMSSAMATRPDIMFAVSNVQSFLQSSTGLL